MLCGRRRRWRAQRKSNRKRNVLNTSECDMMRWLDSRVADMWTTWNLSVSAWANDSRENGTKKSNWSERIHVLNVLLSLDEQMWSVFHFAAANSILTKSFRNHNQWSIFMQFTFPQKKDNIRNHNETWRNMLSSVFTYANEPFHSF